MRSPGADIVIKKLAQILYCSHFYYNFAYKLIYFYNLLVLKEIKKVPPSINQTKTN